MQRIALHTKLKPGHHPPTPSPRVIPAELEGTDLGIMKVWELP